MKIKDKLYSIKMKNFCATNNIMKKVNRQPKEWVKTFVNHMYLIRDFNLDYTENSHNSLIEDNPIKNGQTI